MPLKPPKQKSSNAKSPTGVVGFDEKTFLDAQPTPELIQSGSFELSGMLAALGAQASARCS